MSQLPTPNDMKVVKKEERGGTFASIQFSGWPLDFEVTRIIDYSRILGLIPPCLQENLT